jgi:predicted  nucleic acid-binding Zn-ribbon protein
LQATETEMNTLRKEIQDKQKQIEQNNKEIEKIYDELGKTPNLTEEQFATKSNTPNLGS